MFSEWEDLFDFRFGPFRMGFGTSLRPYRASYSRTKESHLLRLQLSPRLKKEQVKVRLLPDGVLEIEWPREQEGEEIPVE
jgi:hypothetical protein